MNKLYCPWRTPYTKNENRNNNECVFCTQPQANNDEHFLLLSRHQFHYIIMNKYPYNAGHLLIVPFEHVDTLNALSQEACHELIELTQSSIKILNKVLKNHGTNVGINLGKAAGAGIPEHMHTHIVPRWTGDTNFMPIIADTKQISVDMANMFAELKPYFTELKTESF
jgi:ATP adenylyltransferase